ncbi:MAG: hypothetical protein A2622_07070 [Bdellovibrionales bacterium RIFCSPHIGHO2_01_FULL_40_29]|nr:MAG: hypothetical protein A2622_07070 [Bdellovibrionales bacterium RIFCSPHIGHO2_01_FULL_40_29]OFZ33236.1 MAG: hypothetical protein A3D17_12090 [Bdellovibrionales bacterium RIFCSPHIGHO2_02_FULL_40_15]
MAVDMKKLVLSFFVATSVLSQVSLAGNLNTLAEISQRCSVQTDKQEILYENDFHWDMSLADVMKAFQSVYLGQKRLDKRAYYDAQSERIKLPYTEYNGGDVVVSMSFIHAIQAHIEQALKHKYADAIIFPDMGHSHYLIPTKKYKEKYSKFPVTNFSQMYSEIFQDPTVKIVYHTAEQLKLSNKDKSLVSDPYLQWRHFTRNLIGDIKVPYTANVYYAKDQNYANTLGEVPGYFWWGAGFNISANKDGCFKYQYQGKTFYFDMSLFDLTTNPKIH